MSSKSTRTALIGMATFLVVAIVGQTSAQDNRTSAQANFQRADVNKDGKLDRNEFKTFINLSAEQGIGRAPMIRRAGRYEQAFSTLDKNQDATVSREEIAAQQQ